jgi:uncharacterized protein
VDAIKGYGNVAVAFSGGVDSTLLLHAAREASGSDNVLVLQGISELVSMREREAAHGILDELQVAQGQRMEVELHPLMWNEVVANTDDRCYFCKKRMYMAFLQVLESDAGTVLLDGSNVDDLKSGRPGFRAIHELAVQTPLLDAGLNKEEIRALVQSFGVSNYNKPSNSCLATRIATGVAIEAETLALVERCESFLLNRNFIGCRVKPDGDRVVLELRKDDAQLIVEPSVRIEIIHFLQSLGFLKILLDLNPRG